MKAQASKRVQQPPTHAAVPHKPHRHNVRVIAIALATCLVVALGGGSAWAYNYNKLDLTWYTNNRDAQEFTISTAGQMQAFSALVNGEAVGASGNPLGAVSFEGKTVKLTNGVNLMFTGEFTPIGTDAHPFEGTFDGQGKTVAGLSITKPKNNVGIGLFGVTGKASTLRKVSIDDSSVLNLTSADTPFENVGSLVGECRGNIENCSSAARITVNHTATQVSGSIMKNLGGVAGKVQGPISSTSFSGAFKAETPANAYADKSGKSVAFVAENVGGVVGQFGGDLNGCSNSGTLLLITSGASGLDRFGATVEAKSLYVGGVGGYGEGNVTDCHNTATLFTTSVATATLDDISSDKARDADGGADALGGVVGSLRGIAMSGLGDNRGDPGMKKDAPVLTLSGCTNVGFVSGLHTVGGIVGTQGSQTVITRCANGTAGADATSNIGHVRTTRWNKPAGGGIAGQSWGIVSYSRNHGVSENTKTGYFTAGIVGMMEKHEGQATQPEIYACYNTGNVYTVGTHASFYAGGIVGELDHGCYIHDNVFLSGTVASSITDRHDEEDVAAGRNYGTVANSTVVYDTAKQAADHDGIYIKSGKAVAVLNKLAANDKWANYYFITKHANKGYPVLNGEATPDGSIDLSSVACAVDFVQNASFTAAYNPTPLLKVTITIDGKQQELVQGSDYKVLADPRALDEHGACKGITNGSKPYQASIEGIGNYYGSPATRADYGIDRGAFSECTAAAASGKWTGAALNNPAVSVVDAGGSIVSANDYTYTINEGKDCVKIGNYPLVVTAKSASNYQGSTSGVYNIGKADIYKDTDIIGLEYKNRVWYYDEDKSNIYEVIPADEQGNALPEGADLHYNQQGLPYVVPQTYTDAVTGKTSTRTTYANADGHTLSVAEAKHKDAQGKTVYGDMAVDFTGGVIQPRCIGVLYPIATEGYNPHLLKGLSEKDLTKTPSEQLASIDYVWRFGGTNDGTLLPNPRNTNATTSKTSPEASVLVQGNAAGSFANYAYINFQINPIAASADTIKVVQKKTSPQLKYAGGGLPSAPKTTHKDDGNVNPDVEVRYAPNPSTYNKDNASTYCVLDGVNWTLAFDHATSTEGAPLTQTDSGYEGGSEVYYKVVPTKQCSVQGWSEAKIAEPWLVESTLRNKLIGLNEDFIKVTVGSSSYTTSDNPADYLPAIAVRDTKNKVDLTRYTIQGKSAGFMVDNSGSEHALYNEKTNQIEGVVRLTGTYVTDQVAKTRVGYTKTIWRPYTVAKGTLSAEEANALTWIYIDSNQPVYGSPSWTGFTSLNWKEGGWSAEEVSDVLRLGWNSGSHIATENAFTVDSIKRDGTPVNTIDQMGVDYTLSVHFDPARGHYFSNVADGKELSVTVRMKPTLLDWINPPLTIFSNMVMNPQEYSYTGRPIVPQLKVYDGSGTLVNSDYFTFVTATGSMPTKVGNYNVPSETSDPKGRYTDVRVTGDGIHYKRNATFDEYGFNQIDNKMKNVDLSFNVVAADIANAGKVRVEVDEVPYLAGQKAEPAVKFYDAQTGDSLNFVRGTDYTVAYQNNDKIGSASSANPPTAIITPANKNLTVGGSATDSMKVPFTIKSDGADAGDVSWDFAQNIVVHGDGVLSQPGVVGTLDGQPIAADTYEVQAGTYDKATQTFTPQADGWVPGASVYLCASGIKEGVLSGTTVLGPVQAVAASDANTFAQNSKTLKATAENTVYSGIAAQPSAAATDKQASLVEGRDFKVESSSVNVGGATAKISGLGAYAGFVDASFAIEPAAMADIQVEAASKVYSTTQLTLDNSDVKRVTLNGVELPATDWALKVDGYGKNVNVADGATATLVPGTSGNLTGENTFGFTIDPAPLVNDELEVTSSDAVYTGAPVTLTASTVTIHDTKRNHDLLLNEDFVVSGYENNVNAGLATVYLTGTGNYSASANTVTKTFTIAPATFAAANIEGLDATYDWRGENTAVQPSVQVTMNSVVLPTSDYTLSWGDNKTIGANTGTITVTPQGDNVQGAAKTTTFDIGVDVARATVETIPNATYEPQAAYEPDVKVSFNGVPLAKGTHYTVAYDSSAHAGEKTLTISGITPCTGEQKITYNIDGKPLNAAMVQVQTDGVTYTGSAIIPAVVLSDGGYLLTEGTDYEVAYGNNVNATGTGEPATITITGKGNYAGVLTNTFTITPKQLDNAHITATAVAKCLFSGSAVAATTTVVDGGFVPNPATGAAYALVEGSDYTCAYANNTAVGTARATLTGIGNYAGTRVLSYTLKGDMSAAMAEALADQTYTGSAVQPAPVLSLAGVSLVQGVDFTPTYTDNVQPGIAHLVLEGTGLYEGTKTMSFVIATPSYTDPHTGVILQGTALVDLAKDGAKVNAMAEIISANDPLFTTMKNTFATDSTDALFGFSITLQTVKDGKVVVVKDGFGNLQVSLPVGEVYNGRTADVIVRHTADDNTVTFQKLPVTIADGKAVVTVDKLSEFFVAVDKADALNPGAGGGVETPSTTLPRGDAATKLAPTGDSAGIEVLGFAALGCLALVLALMAFPAVFRKMRR